MSMPATHQLLESLRDADESFFQALLDRDVEALERLLAEQFLIVDVASGSIHDRAGFLEAIRSGAVAFNGIETLSGETVVRLAGVGAGIVVGRTAMSFEMNGQVAELSSRYTHVFHADGSGWRLLSAQGTQIPITPASP
jgi:ketosteroid isomerase-like protein